MADSRGNPDSPIDDSSNEREQLLNRDSSNLLKRRGRFAEDDTNGTGTPMTPIAKRIRDNRARYDPQASRTASNVPTTSTLLRNPTKGVFEGRDALPYPATAGSTGFLGREEQQRVTNAANATPPGSDPARDPIDDETLRKWCKLFMFRNLTVSMDDIAQVWHEKGIEMTYKWVMMQNKVEKWRADYQRGLWATDWFLLHVRNNVTAYNVSNGAKDNGFGKDTPYDKKSPQEIADSWTSADRCSLDVFTKILNPLKKAVHIQGVWDNLEWQRYFLKMIVVAADATWDCRCRFMDGKNEDHIDHLQVYEEIRAAPEAHAPGRPSVSQVPVAPDETRKPRKAVNSGRRRIRRSGAPDLLGAVVDESEFGVTER